MQPPPPDRLDLGDVILRAPRDEDAEALLAATTLDLEHLGPWMAWATDEGNTLEARSQFIAECQAKTAGGHEAHYLVLDPAREIVLGAAGLHDRIDGGGLEIGYWLASAATGRGIMTRVAGALTDLALGCQDVTRVEIHCDAANGPSNGVPRRLGFTLDRVRDAEITAPSETGRMQVWIRREPIGPPAP